MKEYYFSDDAIGTEATVLSLKGCKELHNIHALKDYPEFQINQVWQGLRGTKPVILVSGSFDLGHTDSLVVFMTHKHLAGDTAEVILHQAHRENFYLIN